MPRLFDWLNDPQRVEKIYNARLNAEFNNIIGNGGALAAVAFADLPTPVAGMLAYVNNSNTVVWGATVAGGGTDKVLVWYNGTNWTVVGK